MRISSKLIALSAIAATVACAPVAAAPETVAPVATAAPTVIYTLYSWGKPLTVWTLQGDGQLLVETKGEGQGYGNYNLEQRRGNLTPAQAAEVRDGLSAVHGALPHCTVILHDAPSITVAWQSEPAAQGSVYMGCAEEAFRPIITRLVAADAIVRAAVANTPVVGTRHIDP